MLEAKFLRNIIEEFLEVLDSKVFSHSHGDDEDNELVDANGFEKVNDACILYCERFMEFLIVLLSQLLTRSQIHWHGWIPYIELNAQGRARPSIAQLYNWRYRELGDLPNVKEVTTVDKFQGQQNDFILLSLVRTRFVGHLRDVRRLVVAMSRARLGLYVFCRRFLFEQCYELQPTFQLLLQRPDHLALNLNETTSFTDRHVADPGLVQLVSGVEEMSGIVNFKMHQVYQARVMGHQFDQFSAYSGQVAPSLGGWEEQKSQRDSTSQHQPMGTDMPANSHDANGILPPESKPEEATEMEVLENGQDGDLSPENNLKENTDMDGDGGAPLQSRSIDENKME